MRVIPVIDLLGGVVVRGVAGRREAYRPIESRIAADPRPETIARALADDFGFDTVYVADLDAILRGQPDAAAWEQIARAGLTLWLDAGTGDSSAVATIIALAARHEIDARLVIGLESLVSVEELAAIADHWGAQFPIFSLDLKSGQPQTRLPAWQDREPLEIARLAVATGYRDLIVLDLADVGTNSGTRTLALCRQIGSFASRPRLLIAGGGVRCRADLELLHGAGCQAVLAASALHDGRLTPEDIGRWHRGRSTPDP
jgi:phosphoribosylformimino-5-aminoimidazole carboxamide ribotide isomerase